MAVSRDERREMEMARGRAIADRARRRSDLMRYIDGKKVQIISRPDPTPDRQGREGHIAVFYVDGLKVCEECTAEDEYPSDLVMASLALAIGATVGFDNIPPVQPTHKVSEEGRKYREQLQRYNKHRWGD